MITSYTRGRIRLRLDASSGVSIPELPKEGLKGVKSLSVNPRTGSALLEYDPDILSVQTIAAVVETLDPAAAESLLNPHLLKPRSLFGAPIPTLEECPAPSIPVPSPDAPPAPEAKRPMPRLRGSAEATAELINLGIAFLTTILSGFFSSRRLHVQLGALSGLMLLGHVWKHRKRLRPLRQMTWADILGLPKVGPFSGHGHHGGPEEELLIAPAQASASAASSISKAKGGQDKSQDESQDGSSYAH